MKKTMIKNKNMISQFSTTTNLNVNNKLAELKEEKESLQYDLDSIGPAIRAASKISNEEFPEQEENECLEELKDNYPAFFDSEGEEEGASSLLNKLMGVKRYISKELKTNKRSIKALIKENTMEQDPSVSKESTEEKKDSTKQFTIEKGESSKRKADSISDSSESEADSSSKKSRESSTETIDDIVYNPFDDLGTD